jgi:transcriptional regulator with XRE-family HTH domain
MLYLRNTNGATQGYSMKLLDSNALKAFQKSWAEAKTVGDWTQAKMAKALEISQPSFNQYLKGIIPLNLGFILRYCAVLKLDPQRLGATDQVVKPTLEVIAVKVKFSTSGIFYEDGVVRMVSMMPEKMDKTFLVEIDSEYRNIPKGAFLVCAKAACKENNMVVAVSSDGRVVVGALKRADSRWMVVQPLASGDTAVEISTEWVVYKVESIVFADDATDGDVFGA